MYREKISEGRSNSQESANNIGGNGTFPDNGRRWFTAWLRWLAPLIGKNVKIDVQADNEDDGGHHVANNSSR